MQEIWNIAILTSKVSDYTNEYNDLLKDIESLGSSHNMRFIIFEYDGEITSIHPKPTTNIIKYEFSNTKRINTPDENCRDLYNKEHLINFFKVHVIVDDTPKVTNRYIVITWGHGAGLGVFARLTETPKVIMSHAINLNLLSKEFDTKNTFSENVQKKTLLMYAYLKANLSFSEKTQLDSLTNFGNVLLESILSDKSTKSLLLLKRRKSLFSEEIKSQKNNISAKKLEMLTGQDLNEIFTLSFSSQKVDVLITINCFTQMFEFGSGLQQKVSMLVAPQTMVPFYGINYAQLFNFLHIKTNSGKTVNTTMIAQNITAYFWPKYIQEDIADIFSTKYKDFPLRKTSLSCNNLEKYPALEATINSVGQVLFELKKINRGLFLGPIKQARLNCEDLSPGGDYGVIDFTLFFQNVLTQLNIVSNANNLTTEENSAILRLNDLFTNFIETIREEACISMLLGQERNYIQYDGNSSNGINLTSSSPFFVSVFFPDAGISEAFSKLKPKASIIPSSTSNIGWSAFTEDLYK